MRFVLYLLFSFAFLGLPLAQSSDWKQMKTPVQSDLKIILQSKGGFIFATNSNLGIYVCSKDEGKTWSVIEELTNTYSRFKEDRIGRIYIITDETIYKLDLPTLKRKVYLQFPEYTIIYNFEFLSNNNLLVYHDNTINVYDNSTLKKLYSKEFYSYDTRIVIDPAGINNFLFHDNDVEIGLIPFNNDLSKLGPVRILPKNINSGYLFMNQNVLYTTTHYSINGGISWNEIYALKNINISSATVGANNSLYYIFKDTIYISIDKAFSFQKIVAPMEISSLWANNLNGIIIISNLSCDKSQHLASTNLHDWNEIEHPFKKDFCSKFFIGERDFIIQKENFCAENFVKEKTSVPWKQIQVFNNTELHNFYVLKNNKVLSIDYSTRRILVSDNKCNSWNYLSDTSLYNFPEFYDKSSFLMAKVNHDIFLSNKDGEKWQYYTHLPYFDNKYNSFDINSDLNIYYISYFIPKIFRYNPSDSSTLVIESNSNNKYNVGLKTSYNNNKLFLLETRHLTDTTVSVVFRKIIDDGKRVEEKIIVPSIYNDCEPWHLYSDRLDNLMIYNYKNVFLSKDTGSTWQDITPIDFDFVSINDLQVSYDNYIYLATNGAGILKYNIQLAPYLSDNEELLIETQIAKFSPNPTDGTVFIKLAKPMNEVEGILEIFDTKGTKINQYLLQANQNEYIISLENISNGLYFYTLTFGQQYRQQGKLIKF